MSETSNQSGNAQPRAVLASAPAPTLPVRTWRQRLGLSADFPLYMPTDVERAMVAEISDLRAHIVSMNLEGKAPAPLATLTTVDCPACNGKEPCDECHGQGKVIVSRADLDQLAHGRQP